MTASADPFNQVPAENEGAKEQRWINLYCELTGASESQARACWMYLSHGANLEPQPVPVRLDAGSAGPA